jgi:hypothetical protein
MGVLVQVATCFTDVGDASMLYRPLFHVAMALDLALWGIDPRGNHAAYSLLFLVIALLLRCRRLPRSGRSRAGARTPRRHGHGDRVPAPAPAF